LLTETPQSQHRTDNRYYSRNRKGDEEFSFARIIRQRSLEDVTRILRQYTDEENQQKCNITEPKDTVECDIKQIFHNSRRPRKNFGFLRNRFNKLLISIGAQSILIGIVISPYFFKSDSNFFYFFLPLQSWRPKGYRLGYANAVR